MCNVASCWIYTYIGILLGAHPILHISRIKVKHKRKIIIEDGQKFLSQNSQELSVNYILSNSLTQEEMLATIITTASFCRTACLVCLHFCWYSVRIIRQRVGRNGVVWCVPGYWPHDRCPAGSKTCVFSRACTWAPVPIQFLIEQGIRRPKC
jgi:hypothetical protein